MSAMMQISASIIGCRQGGVGQGRRGHIARQCRSAEVGAHGRAGQGRAGQGRAGQGRADSDSQQGRLLQDTACGRSQGSVNIEFSAV